MVEVGKEQWGRSWDSDVRLPRRQPLGGDALAPLRRLADGGDPAHRGRARRGRAGWAYAGALGFALVYLGEHYVIDLIAGAALVARGPLGASRSVEPVAAAVSRGAAAAGADRGLGGLTPSGSFATISGE